MPLYRDLQRVTFSSGKSPIHSEEILIAAEWCSRPDCYSRIRAHNQIDHEGGDFTDAVVKARDLLVPIASGVITRGCRVSQYDAEAGERKTTLKDARPIAQRVIDRLNAAVNKFNERIFE
jgi:hypothetical protein